MVLLSGTWTLVGPYDDKQSCNGAIEWLDTQGYDTETCTMVTTDVDAVLVQIGELPR